MSTKARLISTISAVCMILALLVTGVWAVSTANVTLGGTVTFTADNIHATITGSITGTQETVSITPLVYDADTEPSDEDKATWNNDVNFGSGNLITMKVKVKNESTERSLFVKVTDNTTISNIKKEFTSTVTDVGSGDTYEVIKGGEIEYTLTLSVDQLDYSASATYALDVDLRDANAPEEETVTLLHDTENDYYYVNMGTYNESDVRWRVVGVNGAHYTYNENTAPTGELTFILETLTTTHVYGDYSYEEDENLKVTEYYNNDYATSAIRQYITGHDCALTHDGQDMSVTGDYLHDLGISESDPIYSKIKGRDIQDLYKNIIGYGISDGTTTETGVDKLWIPSATEIYLLVGGGDSSAISGSWEEIVGKLAWNSSTYWLRSKESSGSSCHTINGSVGFCSGDNPNINNAVRPMFILEF